MGQPYRPDMSRFPTTTAHDVYATSTAPITPHTTVNSLPPSSFLTHSNQQPQSQQPQQFQSPHTLLPPTSNAQSYPQPIAPAPPRDRRPDFASMPSGAFSYPDGKPHVWTSEMANGSSPFAAKEPPRTQVVGSQGRRGILPSVPGRAAVTNGVNGAAKNTTIPAKDADGKFPCPHCNKTYLHAKHLKRHLLRHTGDRPYMCVLCKDTFSRSDILKRHFQKCSLRRGNPTGASHLSHPQAHLKRSQAAANAAKPVQDEAKPPVVQDPKRPVMPGPHPNHPGDIDWTSMFQPGAHDGYINPVFPHSMAPGHEPINAHVESERKYYPTTTGGPTQEGGLNGLYLASTSLGGDGTVQPARQ
ncbi:hypothetical protein VTN02DRAFT_2276 [Thermoascus thermophilus]